MSKSKIALIQKRIDKLEAKDFDLEAWKESTTTTLSRVLGESDPAIKQIENLKVDYSSWALRDATSKYNPTETCRRKGREILHSLIDEIEVEGSSPNIQAILKSHLSEDTLAALSTAKNSKKIQAILKKEKKDILANILSEILINE